MSDAAQAGRANMSNGSAQASAIVRIEIHAMAPERGGFIHPLPIPIAKSSD